MLASGRRALTSVILAFQFHCLVPDFMDVRLNTGGSLTSLSLPYAVSISSLINPFYRGTKQEVQQLGLCELRPSCFEVEM